MKRTPFLLISLTAFAADLSSPIVGYSVRNREVRLILGVPGATSYSGPVALPAGVESIRLTPGHRWLLALRADGSAASAWVPETGVERTLEKVSGEPGLISLSPNGAAAAFYWRDANRIVVYAGLPEAPAVTAELAAGNWTSLAVSNDGRHLAGLSGSGELHLLLKDGEPIDSLVRESRAIASFGFFGAANTLAVAEPGSDRIELITATARQSLQLPAAITASARFMPGAGEWFSLVDPDAAATYRLEFAGQVRAFALEGIAVSAFESLRPRGATLLAAPEGGVPRIVLSHADGDDLFYLPTLAAAEEREQ